MGEVVARGKIKVDARKALHKLRDHMLVDLHLWATEIVRVAVTLGATQIDVEWDADDVILSFDGRALAPEAIAGVRNHVLGGDAPNEENDALRLLGIGVTAALGLGPAFVDVWSGDARVRFDASYIEEETSALPVPEAMKREKGAGTTRVHVRKKLGMDILGRAVTREVPRELALLEPAVADAPLFVRGKGLTNNAVPKLDVVMRVDLDVPEATRAVLEVLRPVSGWRAERVFLERGVRLAAYAGIAAWGLREEDVPLRVLVDARRLPTNASRSELRTDTDLFERVKNRIPRALEIALEALQAPERASKQKLGHAVEIVDARPEALREAFGALAACIALEHRSGKQLPESATKLLDHPLMQDAIGAPLTLNAVITAMTRPPVHVFRSDRPEDPMLAPWLSGIPWLRGAAVERLLEAEPVIAADAIVAEARAGGARRARALAHPPSRPKLARTPAQVLVESFIVKEGRFAGLEGEVAVTKREGQLRRSANAHLFVEERLLEIIPLPGTALPIEMALAWPERFRPRRAYDGVERTDAIEEAVHYALRVAAIAIGERAQNDPELARLAIVAWLAASARLKDVTPSIATLGRLANAPAWPTTEAGRSASLVDLQTYAQRTKALCVAPAGSGRAADGRPVLVDDQLVTSVHELLPEGTAIVHYARSLAIGPAEPLEWIGRAAGSMLAHVQITRPNVAGILGVGEGNDARRHRIYHRGVLMRDVPRGLVASLVVEDFGAVPHEDYRRALYVTPIADIEREERALLETVVDRCERGDLDPRRVESYLKDSADDLEGKDPALHARIVELPRKAARAKSAAARAALLARPATNFVRPDGPSGSITAIGVGTVTAVVPAVAVLDTWTPPLAVVRYAGRDLMGIPVTLPVAAFIETSSDDHVGDDWSSLSERGRSWATTGITTAAVELVKNAVLRAEFANDVPLLKLAAALLDDSPTVAARIDHALRKVKWPTVQGDVVTLGEEGERKLRHFGRSSYVSWLKDADDQGSPFDDPAPSFPRTLAGDLRARILRSLGCQLSDATDAFSRLQEQRARRAKSPPPKLAGEPLHPRMRGALSAFGATFADGEIEITEAAAPEVQRIDASGVATPFKVATSLPVRVSFRCEDGDVYRAAGEIAEAAERLVRRLATKLDGLPPAARAAVRLLLCATVARAESGGDLERIDLFPDVSGKRALSLQDMRNGERTRIVTSPPPHPATSIERLAPGSPVIFLWPAEKEALQSAVPFEDITEQLREIVLGDQRRAAPALERVVLDDDLRRACLAVLPVAVGSLTGEVGVLSPGSANLRGIRLHHAKRPLVTLPDADGWPIVAVVNDDTVVPTRGFDGLASREVAARIRNDVRALVAASAQQLFEPSPAPSDALGVIRLPFPFFAMPDRVPCLGILWVDREWPERPEVHVEAPGHVDPFHVPRSSSATLSQIIPVRGKVYVAGSPAQREAALRDVFRHAQKRLGSIIAAARRSPHAPPEETLAAYEWELRLLGERTDIDPAMSLGADRPSELLLRVVARRAPHLLKIEATPPPEPPAPDPAPAPSPQPDFEFNLDAPAPEAPSFFQGLVRKIVELVTGPPANDDPALTNALSQAVVAMKLTGNPVVAVREARRGRPVRFDVETKNLVINTQHEAVRALASDPSRILFLLAAAVSEVNRELEQVTDAEELNVVLDLLRG